MADGSFYVYTYRDPSRMDRHGQAQAWYVGKGTGYRYAQSDKRSRFFTNYLNSMKHPPQIQRFDCADEAGAFELERFLIQEIGRRDLGKGSLVNLTDGGEGATGAVRSPETRSKVSKAHLGKVLSDEHKEKLSKAKLGKVHGPGARAKVSAFHTGRKRSPETVAKLRAVNIGRKHTPETRAKISAVQIGRTVSAEQRAQISARHTGKVTSPETKAKMSEAHKARWAIRRALKDASNG